MKRIDVKFKMDDEIVEQTFRTNDSGCYLFVGVGSNTQISCESGFQDLKRMKKAIRKYLIYRYNDCKIGKISFNTEWF